MTSPNFAHLHVHSDYSMLDGAAKVDAIAASVAAMGQPGFSITDHGEMSGIIRAAKAAAKLGLQFMPGIEAYYVPNFKMAREMRRSDEKSFYHQLLFAYTEEGYRNLMRISSKAYLDQFYSKPLVDFDMLAGHTEGIIATSTCLGSHVNQLLLKGQAKEADKELGKFIELFGKENYYLEIQNHAIQDQLRILGDQVRQAKKFGLKMIATNDCHYVAPEDAKTHDAILAAQTEALLSSPDRFKFESDMHFMRTTAQMLELFPEDEFPGALSNTVELLARAKDLKVYHENQYLIPKFTHDQDMSNYDLLRSMCYDHAKVVYAVNGKIPQEVVDRIEYELKVIDSLGFIDYMLIVADLVRWTKAQGILVGPGRGSCAGSIVAFLSQISAVDPIRYRLKFERFLNPSRSSMPDIDLDFEPEERWRVNNYLSQKYGADKVAFIATYGAMMPKTALAVSAKMNGMPVEVGNQLKNATPGPIEGKEAPIAELLAETPSEKWARHWGTYNAKDLRKFYTDEKLRPIIDTAVGISGFFKQKGVHAAGVLVTPGPLTDYVPVRRPNRAPAHPDAVALPTCVFDKYDVELMGGLKIDLLGLETLTIIKETVRLIKQDLGVVIDINAIPLDDTKTFAMLQKAQTSGVFQIEGAGITDLVRAVKPTNVEDLCAILALYRPGPMGTNLHLQYADVKNGITDPEVPHPDIIDICSDSLGITAYQEQLMEIASHFAGLNGAEADTFRRAVSKKDDAVIRAQESIFKERSAANGFDPKVMAEVWDMIPSFSQYAFNKSHSMAYAFITYQTAWLKSNYPVQFIAANSFYVKDDARVAVMLEEAKSAGYKVLGPDINRSIGGPSTGESHIQVGLEKVSHCSSAVAAKIVAEREAGGAFESIFDFVMRCPSVSPIALTNLVKAGAFDAMHSRKELLADVADIVKVGQGARKERLGGGDEGLFAELEVADPFDEFGPLTGADYGETELGQLEFSVMGFRLRRHPLVIVNANRDHLVTRGVLPKKAGEPNPDAEVGPRGKKAVLYGTMIAPVGKVSKAGKPYVSYALENSKSGRLRVFASREFDPAKDVAGTLVAVVGKLRMDEGSLSFSENDIDYLDLRELGLPEPPDDFVCPLVEAELEDDTARWGGRDDSRGGRGGNRGAKPGAKEQAERTYPAPPVDFSLVLKSKGRSPAPADSRGPNKDVAECSFSIRTESQWDDLWAWIRKLPGDEDGDYAVIKVTDVVTGDAEETEKLGLFPLLTKHQALDIAKELGVELKVVGVFA